MYSESAPISTIEVVSVIRPTKVIAAILAFITAVLEMITLFPTSWFITQDQTTHREGLWTVCTVSATGFIESCSSQTSDYVKAVAALVILAMIVMVVDGIVISLGIVSQDERRKSALYKASMAIALISGAVLLIALIVYPVKLIEALRSYAGSQWMIHWAYGLNWAAFLTTLVVFFLLLCDRHKEDMILVEKIHRSHTGSTIDRR